MKSHSKCLKGQNFELKYEHINYVFAQQVFKPMKSPVGEYKYFLGQHLGKKVKCYKIIPLVHVTQCIVQFYCDLIFLLITLFSLNFFR